MSKSKSNQAVDPSLAALEGVTVLAKAHVKSYVRKDGVAVKEHDDRRAAAAAKPAMVKTQNEGRGYHGEAMDDHVRRTHGDDAFLGSLSEAHTQAAYAAADQKFHEAATKLVSDGHFDKHDDARDFLDSRMGRHLHDGATFHGGDIGKVPWLGKEVKRFKSDQRLQKSVDALAAEELLVKTHVDAYTRKDGVTVAAHDDKRMAAKQEFSHPNVVGHVHDHKVAGAGGKTSPGDGNPLHPETASIGFAGKTYRPTGKSGQSLHDKEPVAEFEGEDSHRVWADGKGRVHADSKSEVEELRAAHAKHAGGDAANGGQSALPEMPELKGSQKTKAKAMLEAAQKGNLEALNGIVLSYKLLDGGGSPHVAYGQKLQAALKSGGAGASKPASPAGMQVNPPIHGSTKKGEDGGHMMYSGKDKDWQPVTLSGVAGAVEKMKNPSLVKKLAQAYIDTAVASKKYDKYHATMLIAQVIDEAGFGSVAGALKEKSGGAPAPAKAAEQAPELPEPPELKSGGLSSMAKLMHSNAKAGLHEDVKGQVDLDSGVFDQNHPDVKALKEFQQKAHAHALHVSKAGGDKESGLAKATAGLEDVLVLAKAHVSAYTRKDGVSVSAHEDSRPAAAAENEKLEVGHRVRVTGRVNNSGKSGEITEQAPSGGYFGVTDKSGKFLGYFHESDLKKRED